MTPLSFLMQDMQYDIQKKLKRQFPGWKNRHIRKEKCNEYMMSYQSAKEFIYNK